MYSCQSLEPISIDYRQPAKITFPSELKRVGIVNNVSEDMPNRIASRYHDLRDINNSGTLRQTKYFNGDAKVATEALAQGIADENYFDLVVICDSALRQHDTRFRNGGLTIEEIGQLTADLNVDLLISLEAVQFRTVKEINYVPEFDLYYGEVKLNAHSTIRVYVPGNAGPIAVTNSSDSIFWEQAGSYNYVNSSLIQENEMIKQASDFAGTLALNALLPSWDTAQRYYFTSGSVQMRDAAVKASEGKWSEATEMWAKAYHATNKARKQYYAAFNTALGYEMQDSIDTAYRWCQTAVEKARLVEKIPADLKGLKAEDAQLFLVAQSYLADLAKRKENHAAIQEQLKRFKEE